MQRHKPWRSKKLRDSARGEECMLMLSRVCNGDTETTVLAHSRLSRHGNGMGTKSHDIFAVYACRDCHDVYDGRALNPEWDRHSLDEQFDQARDHMLLYLVELGRLKVDFKVRK